MTSLEPGAWGAETDKTMDTHFVRQTNRQTDTTDDDDDDDEDDDDDVMMMMIVGKALNNRPGDTATGFDPHFDHKGGA
jgi:hypothetical protein